MQRPIASESTTFGGRPCRVHFDGHHLGPALRSPLPTHLRVGPFERAEPEHAMGGQRGAMEHLWAIAPATACVGGWLQGHRDFPPRQKPGSFILDRVIEAATRPAQNRPCSPPPGRCAAAHP